MYADFKSSIVIELLMKHNGLSIKRATREWFTSKTFNIVNTNKDYSFVSATRCYDELLMEKANDPYWFKLSFV